MAKKKSIDNTEQQPASPPSFVVYGGGNGKNAPLEPTPEPQESKLKKLFFFTRKKEKEQPAGDGKKLDPEALVVGGEVPAELAPEIQPGITVATKIVTTVKNDVPAGEDIGSGEKDEDIQTREWGYGFIIMIWATIIGSITIATWLTLLKSHVTIPNILVNVSTISLILFLFAVVVRYVGLIFMSFFHHTMSHLSEGDLNFHHRRISVLVPAYNEGKVIQSSINSLIELNYDNYEVIVIDDGSTDDTYHKAKQLEGWHGTIPVRVLTQKNGGKSRALNHGVSVATGEIIVCMDADSRLGPDTLLAGVRFFDDPSMAAVAGNVKVVNRINFLTRLQALEYIEGLNLVRRAQALLKAVNIIPGPIGFFRKEVVQAVGGWCSDTYAEDCDLTLTLLTHGYKIDYEPRSVSYTEAPEKLTQMLKQRYRWTRGILQAMKKHRAYLIDFREGYRLLFALWMMIFESILWPTMNILANVMLIIVALLYGMSPLIVLWWVQLTVLDTIAAMHTVAIEREKLYLILYASFYRLIFVQVVDMAKLLATAEEMLGIKMKWGKIERIGRL